MKGMIWRTTPFLVHINYETLTTLSQLDVAKTGATHGPSEVIPLIEHTSSILFYYCWDSIWALLIWECVSRWAVVSAMRYHQSGSANGESTLAFLACLVTCLIRAHYDFVLYCFIWSALWSTSSLRRNYGTVYTMGIYKRCKGNHGNPAYAILIFLLYW